MVHLWLAREGVSDFLIMIFELFTVRLWSPFTFLFDIGFDSTPLSLVVVLAQISSVVDST